MTVRLLLLTLVGAMTIAVAAQAEPYRRLVNFEWDPIEGGESYEIEIKQAKQDGKTFNFKVKDAVWNGRLTPGRYEMKLRALDYRGVPGDWSEPSALNVQLESARLTGPAPKSIVKGEDSKNAKVTLKWDEVPGATSYALEIQSDDGLFKQAEILTGTSYAINLPAAHAYTWRVLGQGPDDVRSEAVSLGEFEAYGGRLDKPKIEKPENEFVREVKWNRPEFADKFDVTVSRKNTKSKTWEKVAEYKDQSNESLAFDPKWNGGDYRVDVIAKGDKRVPATTASTAFRVRKGDRSPAAEFTHEVRKSIDRVNGWYGIASYLITMINYSSINYDKQSATSYNAIGGTGRLGLGHFIDDAQWGFLGIIDMSGFISNDGQNLTYASSELSAVWRSSSTASDRGELRVPVGIYYKQHQVALGNPSTGKVDSYENAAVVGPQAGAEYWYSISPKFGLQANMHLYLSLLKMSTPSGGAVTPTVSTQFGFLGSYRFNKRFTGLAGYARREDSMKYKAADGNDNESTLKGDYLNFFAEYAF